VTPQEFKSLYQTKGYTQKQLAKRWNFAGDSRIRPLQKGFIGASTAYYRQNCKLLILISTTVVSTTVVNPHGCGECRDLSGTNSASGGFNLMSAFFKMVES